MAGPRHEGKGDPASHSALARVGSEEGQTKDLKEP